ncbi:hypothetical protein [Gallaecimonas sp. GXIMD4217]|uniref:hypothetical protein n=1 Tax=Gallaecimonas sp. GXIMD4217 TaxID=3131927 RepID=UPI00311AD66D
MGLFSRKDNQATIGVAFYAKQIQTANADGSRGLALPCEGVEDWPRACKRLLAKLPEKASLHLVLPHSQLHHLSLDKPQAEGQALRDALFWQVKDSLPLPAQDIQMDHYEPPVQPMGSSRVNVVCASRSLLGALASALSQGQRQIQSIGCEELTIARLLPAGDRPQLLLLRNPEQEVLLAVYGQGRLLFSRWLQGYGDLAELEDEELDYVAERLSLDIQRSLDYVESQLRQPPCQSIQLALREDDQGLSRRIGRNFAIPVAPFAPSQGDLAQWMAQAAARGAS